MRGTQGDVHTGRGELRADALQIGFAATPLRMTGVAPAQQQYRADTPGFVARGLTVRGRHRVTA